MTGLAGQDQDEGLVVLIAEVEGRCAKWWFVAVAGSGGEVAEGVAEEADGDERDRPAASRSLVELD
ncbi:hypothetical protein ACIQ9Q_24900 [Streptomyces sp. NPDC094438]|uniref:hypothetical protein n=1 Tax=Streptomyces sp. NPDC094438 TaxID=3366061 RepID=UPI003801A452